MRIDVEWLPPFSGSEEIRQTSASLQLKFGEHNATSFEDEFSKSIQHRARVSAYPLGLWIASSWWRIRWEPAPLRIPIASGERGPDVSWRLSHELPSVGFGFLWPRVTFASDGENIIVSCRPSPVLSTEPFRYLSDFDTVISADSFVRETDSFLDLVLRRLDSFGQTDLHVLWHEVMAERNDPAISAWRRMEARLSYDPDEGPREVLDEFSKLAQTAGIGTAEEIAPACAGRDTQNQLNAVLQFARATGVEASIKPLRRQSSGNQAEPPWHRGHAMALEARGSLRLGLGALSDETLCEILNIQPRHLNPPDVPTVASHVSLGIRDGSGDSAKLLFRKRNKPARRFEAARFLADYWSSEDHWLALTDTTTARQKEQRAFAAEFLCPIDSLKEYLGTSFEPDAIEDAAINFGISGLAIESHLANNGLIPRGVVEGRPFR
ncbi:MAG: hypothetical protein FJW32_01355 [Acidobacteria bacterium]|nr:hypothetical protein [Acidobacteriota bacterium]